MLGMLDLSGDEVVLEAGCGTGRDTARLLERLPDGKVIAVDASARMLEQLRVNLAGRLDRVQTIRADLSEPLPLRGQVDVVFSVAAFHWIRDHDALFRNLASVLRPGGMLAADCGGPGNIAEVSSAIAAVSGKPAEAGIWNFAAPDETARRLERAGFSNVQVEIHSEPEKFRDEVNFKAFLRTVILGSHLVGMEVANRELFVDAVAERLPHRCIDYVRLTLRAIKGRNRGV